MRLEGKVALITGAARGVGFAVAKRFANEGAKIIMADINQDLLASAAAELSAQSIVLNVAEEADWQRCAGWIETNTGKLDILFNNAAILRAGLVDQASLKHWRELMAINADSVFLATHYCLPLLEKQGGAIINMSSSSALMGMPEFCAYTAAKSAVRSLTMSTAVLCKQRKHGVRCNSIHPDGINTDMVREIAMTLPQHVDKDYSRSIPFVCQPEDVANLALFLASDESRHINGAALNIDNTATIHPPY